MTQEVRLQRVGFKEIRKESLCNTNIDKSVLAVDRVASTVLLNENNSILAKIVGLECDCDYAPIDGNGCYISQLEYVTNIPLLSIGDLIQAFTYGAQYGIREEKDVFAYKYNYIWFDLEDGSRSFLTRFYGDKIEEVFSDEKSRVFIIRIR